MADEKRDRPNLKDEDVSVLRNRQRNDGNPTVDEGEGPEGNATMRRAWSEPGGEAQAYRSATKGAGGDAEEHGRLTEEEARKGR